MKHFRLMVLVLATFSFLWVGCFDDSAQVDDVFENRFVAGEFAYVPFETKLITVDISNPKSPEFIEALQLEFRVTDSVVDYPHLYVAKSADSAIVGETQTDGGILKFDISTGRPELVDQISFPPFPKAITHHESSLFVSGIDQTWVFATDKPLRSNGTSSRFNQTYNSLMIHQDSLFAGGGGCSFRTGHCWGWLDRIDQPGSNAPNRMRVYEGELPIFDMRVIDGRLVTFGRGVTSTPIAELNRFPAFHLEHAGGTYSGLMTAEGDGSRFYLIENHELLIYQFGDADALPQLVGREGSAPMGTYFTQISIKDSYVYAVSNYGLHLIDVSNPSQPFGAAFIAFESINDVHPVLPHPSPTWDRSND